jgi:hypothetical protein
MSVCIAYYLLAICIKLIYDQSSVDCHARECIILTYLTVSYGIPVVLGVYWCIELINYR